jgi:FAD/FMN-containing dehydrogenase
MFLRSYLYAALASSFNIVISGLTLERYIWLEGRVRQGLFRNWARRFRYRPSNFAQPRSVEEIVALVRNSVCLRVFGAGRGRRSTWIDLLCNDSAGHEMFFEAAERRVKEIGARPHLGKYCRSIDRTYLEQVHGEYFTQFRRLAQKHDPRGKFVNSFTQRLFEPEAD